MFFNVAQNITARRIRMTPFTLLILMASDVWADMHLHYHRAVFFPPGPGLPAFSVVGYVDDQEIESYNSDVCQSVPKTEWMKKLGPEYWERETKHNQIAEIACKQQLQAIKKQFTKTQGLHVYQEIFGCELSDDGSTVAALYNMQGYNGKDLMYLDTQKWLWIPVVNEARFFTHAWNQPGTSETEKWKNYLTNTCVGQLKNILALGREDLKKKVVPEVKVWGHHQSDGVTRLYCLVYGFYPQTVHVKWMRNGVDYIPSDKMSPILPHPDGTYRIRVSVEVPQVEEDAYSCHVEHSSLQETLSITFKNQCKSDGPYTNNYRHLCFYCSKSDYCCCFWSLNRPGIGEC
ncbi:major histocompatibility complex class I-related gene protein-like [Pyxicephalus adspersus]